MIDLRSDTVTLPTPAMKQAMLSAPLGDDVLGDCPTVEALEARCAELSGKEAAIFLPTGTMANLLAIRVNTQPGDEVLLHEDAHPIHFESGGAAHVAGVSLRGLTGHDGFLHPEAVAAAIRPPTSYFAPARLVCVEDTTNLGGGHVYPLERLDALIQTAQEHGLHTHLDGARLWNAMVRSGETMARRAQGFDTVSFCFAKGLGAPAGSALCADKPRIERARRFRRMAGGAIHQAGMLAAAALYAMEHHVERLSEDHRRARELAMGLMIEGFAVKAPQTNIVYVEVPGAGAFVERLAEQGVACFAMGPSRLRLVFHMGIDDQAVDATQAAFRAAKG